MTARMLHRVLETESVSKSAVLTTRNILLTAFFVIASVCIAACALLRPETGKVFDSWETRNSLFRITITAHEEGVWTGGANYIFKSAPASSDQWQQIMRFRHNDPIPIARNQVRFVDDQIAFLFMGWMYAVTTDAGKTWSVWNAEEDLPNWECCNYLLIKDINLTPNGIGTMQLNAVAGRSGEVPELHTVDYGRHWK